MLRYKNTSGLSSIEAFDLGAGSITVKLRGGARDLYDEDSADAANIARMQRLAHHSLWSPCQVDHARTTARRTAALIEIATLPVSLCPQQEGASILY